MKKRLNVMNLLKKYFKIYFIICFAALVFINADSFADVIEGSIRKEIKQTQKRDIEFPPKEIKYSNAAILAYNKGIGYYRISEYDKSIESFKSAIKQEPRFADAYFNLGVLYDHFDNKSKAVVAFNRAYAINKKDDEALFYVIKCYTENGDTVAAQHYFKKLDKDSVFYENAKELIK